MCWPRIEGGLEIEERYPRTNDPREPRRKRLNFIRNQNSSRRDSDDYALMRSSFHNARPIRAEMREQHDPRVLQQQEMHMRQLQAQNQDLTNRLAWQADQQRRIEAEQAQNHGHPPPPPHPPGMIAHPPQQPRIMHHPHEGYPEGIEPVQEWQPAPRPHIVEAQPRPRSRMPNNIHHGRSPSRGRSHGRHHSGGSIYSDDRYSDRDNDRRRRGRSPIVYGSSHDSFEDLLRHPHIPRVDRRRRR
ncbi:MAG: hypothetical protein L6R39_003171 [Caloplaca ligustica]|nr:MAG: hypothetical protein L6R39_003171 [Caloplaca ligustica]